MRFGICTGIDRLNDAYDAGYDYAELGAYTLIARQDEADFAPIRRQILEAPIPVEALNLFLPGDLRVTGPEVDLGTVGAYMDTVLRRASEIGAKIMVFGSGGARRIPDDFPIEQGRAQFIEAAQLAGETAARYGVRIALEPLNTYQCNFFNRVDEGAEIVDEVNHPNLRLLTDLYHITAANEPFENIVTAGERLIHIHLATPALPETGEGHAYDFQGFFAALARLGYDDRISVEDNPGLLREHQPPLTETFRAILEYVKSFAPVKA